MDASSSLGVGQIGPHLTSGYPIASLISTYFPLATSTSASRLASYVYVSTSQQLYSSGIVEGKHPRVWVTRICFFFELDRIVLNASASLEVTSSWPLGVHPPYWVPVGILPDTNRVNDPDDMLKRSAPVRPLAIPVPMMKGTKPRARSAVFPFCADVNLYEPRGARNPYEAYSPALYANKGAKEGSIHRLVKSFVKTIASASQISTRRLSTRDKLDYLRSISLTLDT